MMMMMMMRVTRVITTPSRRQTQEGRHCKGRLARMWRRGLCASARARAAASRSEPGAEGAAPLVSDPSALLGNVVARQRRSEGAEGGEEGQRREGPLGLRNTASRNRAAAAAAAVDTERDGDGDGRWAVRGAPGHRGRSAEHLSVLDAMMVTKDWREALRTMTYFERSKEVRLGRWVKLAKVFGKSSRPGEVRLVMDVAKGAGVFGSIDAFDGILLASYGTLGKHVQMEDVFFDSEMHRNDRTSDAHLALSRGYARGGEPVLAEVVLRALLRRGCSPGDLAAWSNVAWAYGVAGFPGHVQRVARHMEALGLSDVRFSHIRAFLGGCAHTADAGAAHQLVRKLLKEEETEDKDAAACSATAAAAAAAAADEHDMNTDTQPRSWDDRDSRTATAGTRGAVGGVSLDDHVWMPLMQAYRNQGDFYGCLEVLRERDAHFSSRPQEQRKRMHRVPMHVVHKGLFMSAVIAADLSAMDYVDALAASTSRPQREAEGPPPPPPPPPLVAPPNAANSAARPGGTKQTGRGQLPPRSLNLLGKQSVFAWYGDVERSHEVLEFMRRRQGKSQRNRSHRPVPSDALRHVVVAHTQAGDPDTALNMVLDWHQSAENFANALSLSNEVAKGFAAQGRIEDALAAVEEILHCYRISDTIRTRHTQRTKTNVYAQAGDLDRVLFSWCRSPECRAPVQVLRAAVSAGEAHRLEQLCNDFLWPLSYQQGQQRVARAKALDARLGTLEAPASPGHADHELLVGFTPLEEVARLSDVPSVTPHTSTSPCQLIAEPLLRILRSLPMDFVAIVHACEEQGIELPQLVQQAYATRCRQPFLLHRINGAVPTGITSRVDSILRDQSERLERPHG